MSAENRIKERCRHHHVIIPVLCVVALGFVCSSLYSISRTVVNIKQRSLTNRRVKLSTRSLEEVNKAEGLLNSRRGTDVTETKNRILKSNGQHLLKHDELKQFSNETFDTNTDGSGESTDEKQNGAVKILSPVSQTELKKYKAEDKHSKLDVPIFPENYHASGLIILPHSNIAEPFEIWYAPSIHKSRIDYYYGTDKTFQRGDHGDHGKAYKYVPMYSDKKGSFDGCWTVTGNKNRPVIPQIVTPNITWFKYNLTEVYTGTMATKWIYEYYAFGMRNFQNVWITKAKPHRPIRYEMFGYDMMLGSYYDHYVIEYITFEDWNVDDKVFELPSGIVCFNWSNTLESSLMANPMQEFTAFSADKAFNNAERYKEYKAQQQKNDMTSAEETERSHIYKHNVRYINSHNRKNLQFKLKSNHLLDLTKTEIAPYHGSLEKDPKNHKGIKNIETIEKEAPSHNDIPDEIDWRDYGAVSHVKGQGICGACYAFTAAGAAEGAWYRKTGNRIEVSTQQLVDCSWGYGNHGCKGGHYATALSWIFTHGISTDHSYGKYLAQEGYCHFNDTWFGAKIDGFWYVQPWNKTALKRAIVKYGPVAVSVNTLPLSFKFYSHGVYNDPECLANQTRHSALVIGYGKQNGKKYWLLKNSWSTTWGEDGYIKIAMDNDLCGVTEYPVAVIMNKPEFQLPLNLKSDDTDYGSSMANETLNSQVSMEEQTQEKVDNVSDAKHQEETYHKSNNQSVSKQTNNSLLKQNEAEGTESDERVETSSEQIVGNSNTLPVEKITHASTHGSDHGDKSATMKYEKSKKLHKNVTKETRLSPTAAITKTNLKTYETLNKLLPSLNIEDVTNTILSKMKVNENKNQNVLKLKSVKNNAASVKKLKSDSLSKADDDSHEGYLSKFKMAGQDDTNLMFKMAGEQDNYNVTTSFPTPFTGLHITDVEKEDDDVEKIDYAQDEEKSVTVKDKNETTHKNYTRQNEITLASHDQFKIQAEDNVDRSSKMPTDTPFENYKHGDKTRKELTNKQKKKEINKEKTNGKQETKIEIKNRKSQSKQKIKTLHPTEKDKKKILNTGKSLHQYVKKLLETFEVSNDIPTDKPTLNPESVGSLQNDQTDVKSKSKQPVMLGSKKENIENNTPKRTLFPISSPNKQILTDPKKGNFTVADSTNNTLEYSKPRDVKFTSVHNVNATNNDYTTEQENLSHKETTTATKETNLKSKLPVPQENSFSVGERKGFIQKKPDNKDTYAKNILTNTSNGNNIPKRSPLQKPDAFSNKTSQNQGFQHGLQNKEKLIKSSNKDAQNAKIKPKNELATTKKTHVLQTANRKKRLSNNTKETKSLPTLSRLDKAIKYSMADLYSRIDNAVRKKPKGKQIVVIKQNGE